MMNQVGGRLVQWVNPGARFAVGPCSAELALAGLEIEWDGPLHGTARLRPSAACRVAMVKVCLEEWSIVPRDLGESTSELAALTVGVPFFLARPRNGTQMRLSEHSEIVLAYDFPLAPGHAWEQQFSLTGPWGRPFASRWRVRLEVVLAGTGRGSGVRAVYLRPAAPFCRCARILAEVSGTRVAGWELRTAYEDSVGRPLPHLDAALLDPLMNLDAHSSQPLDPTRVAGVRAYLNSLGDPERLLERVAGEWASPALWRDLFATLGQRRVRLEVALFSGRLHGTVAFGYGSHRGLPFDFPADDPFEARRQFVAILRARKTP